MDSLFKDAIFADMQVQIEELLSYKNHFTTKQDFFIETGKASSAVEVCVTCLMQQFNENALRILTLVTVALFKPALQK